MNRSSGLKGFTLVETLISVAILSLLVVLVAKLFASAGNLTATSTKRINTESQWRPVFDRLAIDFAQMIKRSDVDYFLKSPTSAAQNGNDRIAFFSQVGGYGASGLSPISLVAYRINNKHQLERMGKALSWNGDTTNVLPLTFSPVMIASNWPTATNDTADSDYEVIAPQIFRFEYYYVLRSGTLSSTPWDTSAGHSSVTGVQDVAAICVALATIDTKSKVLLSDSDIASLAANLSDFNDGSHPGDLLSRWQATLDGTKNLPRAAISEIRLSERSIPVTSLF